LQMRVLVACEYSGRVREAFRRRGHDAWSCDLLPAEDGSEFHFQCDVLDVPMGSVRYGERWDLMVAHPPCTHLSVSGARHFDEKRADGRQQVAIDFFLKLANLPIPRIAIENPICIMSSVWREPDQIIQPWQFGHGETKATCLWLKGLPPLKPTNIVPGREPRIHRMSPGPDRWKERSRTYEGIAEAMAEQWGDYSDLVTQAEAA
jgi:site-specific DNA-cytosine methylase